MPDTLRSNIPNLITLGNLLCGAIGIERVIAGDMFTAFLLILIAAFLDFFDGLSARLMGVDGEFGKQLDSLADLVSFGILPGLIVYHYMMLYGYCYPNGFCTSRYSWLALPAGAAWRLARFNISKDQIEGFKGVPVPIVGISFGSLVLALDSTAADFGSLGQIYSNFYFLATAPVIAAWLMVSDLPMLALKFKKGDEKLVWKLTLVAVCAVVIALFQKESGMLILLAYVFTSLLANFAFLKTKDG